MRDQMNILLCGIGGQGIVKAGRILCSALGHTYDDVMSTDIYGVGQRGGSVVTHIRAGKNIYSHQIPPGEADIIIGFEQYELARWIETIKTDGIVIASTIQKTPNTISLELENPFPLAGRLQDYKDQIYYFDHVREDHSVPASRVNALLLGGALEVLNIEEDLVRDSIKSHTKEASLSDNFRAFDVGVNLWNRKKNSLKEKL